MKNNQFLCFLLFICLFCLVSCDQDKNIENDDIINDVYEIVIGDDKYNLFPNHLSDDEIYILSNVEVEANEDVTVLKNGINIEVKIDGTNNLFKDSTVLKIHNDATAQIVLTVTDETHLMVSGYDGAYSNLESTVKEGYVVAYSYDNHISYTGYIQNGIPHGEGIYIWSMTNCIYFGEFKEGKYDGKGTFVWHNGDKLVGEFFKGNPVNGEYTYASSGCTYNGAFNTNWKYEGEGVFSWPSGWRFEGTFSNCKALNGKTYTNRNTGVIWYEGAMNDLNDINQNQVGTAYYVFENGCTYLGGYKSKRALETGKYHGQGVFTWKSGWKFEGEFVDGVAINGKTTTTKTKGLIWYVGEMNDLNDIKSSVLGYGRFIQSDGTIYEGQMYASGAIESCTYSGEGKLIYPNGTEVSGTFSNGKLVSEN